MSRWWLVGLACVAGMLLWIIATWPLPPEVDTSDEAVGDSHPVSPVPAPVPARPVVSAEPLPPPAAAPTQLEPSAEPTSAAEPESAEAEAEKIFTRENGPLAELKAQFEKEPRDSAANEAEQVVRAAFEARDSPKPVFRAVLCRESICRVETRFSHATLGAYVAAMTRLVHGKFGPNLASERTSLAEAGEVSVTVYAKRPPPAE